MSDAPTTENSEEQTTDGDGLILGESVGFIGQVATTSVTVTLSPGISRPLAVGEILAIEGTKKVILGEASAISAQAGEVQVNLTLTATVDLNTLAITPGVTSSVAQGATAHRAHDLVVVALLEGRASLFEDLSDPISLSIGASPLCPRHALAFSPERIFGRHCAIVGTSGSGKSWTTARLIEQCAARNAKILLLDPSGEYSALQGPVRHVHLGSAPVPPANCDETSLPYYELTEADLVAILRPTNATQLTKLRAAIRSLKLLQFDPRLGVDGNLPKANRLKTPYELAFAEYRDEVTQPENRFNISNLAMQIGLECVEPIRSHTESNYWGGLNASDHNDCVPLISKLEDLLQSNELQCLLRPSRADSLISSIEGFLRDPAISVLRISCEYLPTINRTREIMANAVARHLLGMARAGDFRSAPLILAVDEAHQMLPKATSHLSVEYPLEAFNIIAKEGRKYGLTLCIATQRPGDIPDDVLGQVGSFFAHRLVSDADRGAIERASGNVSPALKSRLPLLAPGEAFLMGVDFQSPLRLLISKPSSPPRSRGPDYQGSWGSSKVQ